MAMEYGLFLTPQVFCISSMQVEKEQTNMILIVGATGILGGYDHPTVIGGWQEVAHIWSHNSPAEELAKQRMATSPRLLIEAARAAGYGDLKDVHRSTRLSGHPTVITTATQPCAAGRIMWTQSIAWSKDATDRSGQGGRCEGNSSSFRSWART